MKKSPDILSMAVVNCFNVDFNLAYEITPLNSHTYLHTYLTHQNYPFATSNLFTKLL